MAHSQAQESKGARDQSFPPEQEASEAINFACLGQGILYAELPGEGSEIAVAHLNLHGVGTESAPFQFRCNVVRLGLQAGAEDWPIVGIVEEGLLSADALDFITRFQRAVVLAESELFQARCERPDQSSQITRGILQIPDRAQSGLNQDLFRDFADSIDRSDGQGTSRAAKRPCSLRHARTRGGPIPG